MSNELREEADRTAGTQAACSRRNTLQNIGEATPTKKSKPRRRTPERDKVAQNNARTAGDRGAHPGRAGMRQNATARESHS